MALLALSAPSQATLISASVNDPYSFSWNDSTAAGNLSGTGTLKVSGFNSSLLSVQVTLNNTSTLSTNRLTSFGFGIDPNAKSVAFSDTPDGGMVNVSLSSIPGLASIEVCAFGGVNCPGGANGGIYGGASDTFTLLLGGAWGSSVNIDPLGFKYQTAAGSFEFYGPQTTSVPEPETFALLGFALAGLGLFSRRMRRAP